MTDAAHSQILAFSLLNEPALSFSPVPGGAEDVHPLRGLITHGPYTKESFGAYSSVVRVITVGPASAKEDRFRLMRSLKSKHAPTERKEYVPNYPGFEALFRVNLSAVLNSNNINWPDALSGETPIAARESLLQLLDGTIARLDTIRSEFDVALIHFPDSWQAITRSPGFDAHDILKAKAARRGIATQVINDRAFSFQYPASLAWRLAIAIYVKAGGIPWKLARVQGVPEETAYIGLAYALSPENAHFITCCSQVFDSDGGGMEFVAFQALDPIDDIHEARRNPFLSRDDMRAVMTRSLSAYQKRNGGRLPKRLVIHKTTAFREAELDGVFDATAGVPAVDCLDVSTSGAWRGVWLIESGKNDGSSKAAGYPVPRGTIQISSGASALVWVAGNAPQVSNSGNFYQGGKSIPRPITLTRHAGEGPLEISALEALALSKMDWNNDALYDPVPVTITYSQKLARTIANVPDLPGTTYPYRLFM